LEISPNKFFLGESQINNSSGNSKPLENLPIEFPPEKHGSIVNPNKFLTTLSGTKKGKGKSTSSSSQSSSGQDISDEGEEGSNPNSGEGSTGPLTPPNPNPPDLIDPPVSPPPSPPPLPPPEEKVDQMANLNRPLNIAAYPIFYGLPGTDPDMHVSRFLAVCAANRVLNQDYLRTFPATLDGAAFSWYQRQPKIATWDALRDAFTAQYRPLGFRESLIERLKNIRMGVQESVDSFYGRMQDVLNRWGNHQVLDEMLKSIFVGGLWPVELKMFVKERRPAELTIAYQMAKTWEEARVDEDFLPYAEITSFPTNKPQSRNTPAAMEANIRPEVVSYQPLAVVVAKDSKITNKAEDQMMEKLNELTNQFSEMKVNMAGNLNKRPKPTNTRTNVWCTNCQG
jgi:hypothetical protein